MISQERLEKFWKRWGFETTYGGWWYPPSKIERTRKYLPALTLDNLFKYAVPANSKTLLSRGFLFYCHLEYSKTTGERVWSDAVSETSFALALFLALEKLKEVEG